MGSSNTTSNGFSELGTNGETAPTYVNVVGCTEPPCVLTTGTDVEMYMNFTATQPIDTLDAKVYALLGIVPIPFPLPEPDACKGLTNTHCPLEINKPAQYKLQMPILDVYPKITIPLKLWLESEGNIIVCCIIDIQVVKP
ncbi:hypothetical protein FQR65_LT07259 [Abscondita terminalis]|nr:hypothetical protein FQR65_LT07259 [Abscondita terminalis]